MTEHLAVKCKACGGTFRSPIAADRAAFATATMTNNGYQCPACREVMRYDKVDHFFVAD